MLTMPNEIMPILHQFAPVFSERMWDWSQVLVLGAILAPKQRTVSAVLRILGLGQEKQYQNYHRVLNRASWSGLAASKILLGLLVATLVAAGVPVVVAADETLERRRGAKIAAKGYFRDPVLSSEKRAVVSAGLRWVSMMLLVTVPWSKRVWALPFLTVLAPHEKANVAAGKRHKTSIDLIGQMIGVVRRWLPQRALVLVVDGGLVALRLGLRCIGYANPVTLVLRLHLNICLYDAPTARQKGQRGRAKTVGARQPKLEQRATDPATKWTRKEVGWYGGKRRVIEYVSGTAWWKSTQEKQPLPMRWVLVRDPLGKFKTAAFGCTDLNASVEQILAWYVMRWNVEVTFQECRAHLGMATQRQWSERAIARTTPALLGLFSLVVLLAHHLTHGQALPTRSAAWYTKSEPTFVDALALVRRHLWQHGKFLNPGQNTRLVEFPAALLDGLVETLCYVA